MITGASGRVYDPLPIDSTAGLPQSFPYLLNGVRYQIALYANVPEWSLGSIDEMMTLPDGKRERFLVVRVDILSGDGTKQTVFLRKVVPSLEYCAGALMLTFPTQRVARRNLNGVGNFGSILIGGATSS